MRVWAVLAILLLAGCTAPSEPEREPRLLLLGFEPCHEGICHDIFDRGLVERELQPLLSLEQGPAHFVAGDDAVYWLDERDGTQLWAFDTDRRELVSIATWRSEVHIDLAAEGDALWFVVHPADGKEDSKVWRWDWQSRAASRLDWGLDGPLHVLDVDRGEFLVTRHVGVHHDSFIANIGTTSTTVLDNAEAPGRGFAAFGGNFLVFSFANGHDASKLWVQRNESLSPVWTADGTVEALHASGPYFSVGQQREKTSRLSIVDPQRAVALLTAEGSLMGQYGAAAAWLWPSHDRADEIRAQNIFDQRPQTVASLLGLRVLDWSLVGDQLYLSVAGGYEGIVTVDLPGATVAAEP